MVSRGRPLRYARGWRRSQSTGRRPRGCRWRALKQNRSIFGCGVRTREGTPRTNPRRHDGRARVDPRSVFRVPGSHEETRPTSSPRASAAQEVASRAVVECAWPTKPSQAPVPPRPDPAPQYLKLRPRPQRPRRPHPVRSELRVGHFGRLCRHAPDSDKKPWSERFWQRAPQAPARRSWVRGAASAAADLW